MPSGILIIDKPAGWTSMDVCAKLRGILGERRIGHGGTLDPMATGVLPVFVGSATKAVEFAETGDKEYVAGLRLGMVTNTQDSTGEVLEERAVSADRGALEAVLPRFTGPIRQIPPMFSAIKREERSSTSWPGRVRRSTGTPGRSPFTLWRCWSRRGRTGSCSGSGVPRAPMSAPCATTSDRLWAAADVWTSCAGPWRQG